MGAGAPIENKNAEKWTIKEAKELFLKALDMSKDKEYDFIGEIARDLGVYRDLFTYLSDKFKNDLNNTHKTILSNLEANCFSHAKKGIIKEASAIINLKSNYKWRDRVDNTSGDEPIQPIKLDPETAKAISKKIEDNI